MGRLWFGNTVRWVLLETFRMGKARSLSIIDRVTSTEVRAGAKIKYTKNDASGGKVSHA